MSRGRPSAHGAALGRVLADWADRGRDDRAPGPCVGCAFRVGTIANQLAGTVSEALNCALGIDDAPFACHKGMKDGVPQRPCAGWLAARRAVEADWGRIKADMAALVEFEVPLVDEVAARFETFLDRVDPKRKLDDYRLADLWIHAPEREKGLA